MNNKVGSVSYLQLVADAGTPFPAGVYVKPGTVQDTTHGKNYKWDGVVLTNATYLLLLKITCTAGKTFAAKKGAGVVPMSSGIDSGQISITLTDGTTDGPAVTDVQVDYVTD